jgi:hypothetical protein
MKSRHNIGKVYVCIDFESANPDMWCSFGAVVASYPQGTILDTIEVRCSRTGEDFEHTSTFWKQHPKAHKHNTTNTLDPILAEKHIVSFIEQLNRKYFNFYLVSDNPSNDVRLLDNILIDHDMKGIAFRPNGYRQSICTWSFRIGIQRSMKLSTQTVSTIIRDHVHRHKKTPLYTMMSAGERHTPLVDACHILQQHFIMMDITDTDTVPTGEVRR